MKNLFNSRLIFCFAICAFSIIVLGVYSAAAQPPPPDDPNSVPIDGGLSFLLGAGAAAAAWKYRKALRRRSDF
jgi:hypothetical protein